MKKLIIFLSITYSQLMIYQNIGYVIFRPNKTYIFKDTLSIPLSDNTYTYELTKNDYSIETINNNAIYSNIKENIYTIQYDNFIQNKFKYDLIMNLQYIISIYYNWFLNLNIFFGYLEDVNQTKYPLTLNTDILYPDKVNTSAVGTNTVWTSPAGVNQNIQPKIVNLQKDIQISENQIDLKDMTILIEYVLNFQKIHLDFLSIVWSFYSLMNQELIYIFKAKIKINYFFQFKNKNKWNFYIIIGINQISLLIEDKLYPKDNYKD